jgi:hypothetical protein
MIQSFKMAIRIATEKTVQFEATVLRDSDRMILGWLRHVVGMEQGRKVKNIFESWPDNRREARGPE